MRRDGLRVLLAGGGSGGSATPVLAVGERLRELEPSVQLLLVGTEAGPERGLAASASVPFAAVPSGKLRRYWSVQNFTDPFRVVAGVGASASIVRRFRPSVGFGAGGFASVPPLAAAALLGHPIHVHQQDAEPGLANRLLVPLARSCSVSLQASLAHFPLDRTRLTGNPVRPSILRGDREAALRQFRLERDVPLVLVTGGGTGALGLNRVVAAAAPLLVGDCQVVHLTGRGRGVRPDSPIRRYQQHEFVTTEMADLLAASTLAVTRAGMGILSELAALGKPTILIPMPGSHQAANAGAFAERGAVIVLDELQLTPESLAESVGLLLTQPSRLAELSTNIRASLPPDAADRLARLVLDLARQPRNARA